MNAQVNQSYQLNFLDVLKDMEVEARKKQEKEKPYFNGLGQVLPWEEDLLK